ncbi:MAG: hypothetical protein IJR54_03665 [Oscillibacter sp.]|nr:hypothetical protein [Oscillibacter sp.]
MLTKEQLLDEARKQKKALSIMGRWRNWLFVLTTSLMVLAVFGLRKNGALFVMGIISVVLAVLCFVFLLLVNLSIRNGHRNVERLLDSIQ